MIILLHILLGFLFSFIGYIPPGVINVTIADMAIRRGRKAAMLAILGAALIEWFQAYFSLRFIQFFHQEDIQTGIEIAIVIVFYLLSIYNFRLIYKKKKTTMSGQFNFPPFWQGAMISAINLFSIPYWLFSSTYLHTLGVISKENYVIVAFCMGVTCGTILLLFLYAHLASRVLKDIDRIHHWANLFLGGLFFVLATYQLVVLLT